MKQLDPFELNIASQPFRRERAEMTGVLLACGVLAISALVLGGLILHSQAAVKDLRKRIDSDAAQLSALQVRQNRFGAVLSKPDNTEVFSNSVFLNQLIARRGLSWSRIFKDLEEVLPTSIRLLAIRLPQVAEEDADGVNRVQLDMVVGTTQPEQFLILLKRLEQASNFGATSVVSATPPSQTGNDPYFKYRLTVAYAQKL
jgi:type IV pilus assembly protein PilN